jgi:hypothetical protein
VEPKCCFFTWLLLQWRLPTVDRIIRQGDQGNSIRRLCYCRHVSIPSCGKIYIVETTLEAGENLDCSTRTRNESHRGKHQKKVDQNNSNITPWKHSRCTGGCNCSVFSLEFMERKMPASLRIQGKRHTKLLKAIQED